MMNTDGAFERAVWVLRVIFLALLTGMMAPATAQDDGPQNDRWSDLRMSYFGDRVIHKGEEVIELEAPARALDAATVPVTIRALDPERQIREVYLFVDQNPLPLAGIFRFTEEAGFWNMLETRIRVNEYTNVRAVGVLSNGELYMSERFVKASGGCSAPAMADMDKAMARAGKMQLMLEEIYQDDELAGNGQSDRLSRSEAVIKISHPNNSGMQFDQVSRNYIPAFYVNHITAGIDGVDVLDIDTNFSMSENPVVRVAFGLETRPTSLEVVARDSRGNEYQRSTTLAAQ
jgi:sulfur-oxidizing protein SoxY